MSLATLEQRLNYYGGRRQEDRMINDKLRSLKRALLYSYQAATAVLADNREFRCLINPDKNSPSYDDKIISIPYKDICLNKERIGRQSEGEETIGLVPGNVFTWKETNTHWLVYLQDLEEDAYFRAQIRRCDQQVQVNGTKYWVYIRGPVETSIEWNQKKGIEWNNLNHSLVMYITQDQNTKNYFYRFQKFKVFDPKSQTDKTWQVVDADPYYGDGIIQVFLDEYFENTFEDANKKAQAEAAAIIPEPTPEELALPRIEGPTKVAQYSKQQYTIKNMSGGQWYVLYNGVQKLLKATAATILLDIPIKQLGTFTLIYRKENEQDVTLDIQIIAL